MSVLISASRLKRHCGYPRVLDLAEPRTAKEKEARARRDEAAGKGTVFHAAIEEWKATGILPQPEDDEVRGWLDLLAATGWAPQPWTLLEVALGLRPDGSGVMCNEPQPHVYVARDGSPLVTAGRADVVQAEVTAGPTWTLAHIIVVRDWKTGRWHVDPPEKNLQLTALALAACELAQADGFRREVYYAREGQLDGDEAPVFIGTEAYYLALADVFDAARIDDTPRPGAHCEPCWERRMKRCAHAQKTFQSESD